MVSYHSPSHHCCQSNPSDGCRPCGCQCTPQNCTWILQVHRWVLDSYTSPRVHHCRPDSLYNHHIHMLMEYTLHSGRWTLDWSRCGTRSRSHHCRPHSHSHGHSWGGDLDAQYRFYKDFKEHLIWYVVWVRYGWRGRTHWKGTRMQRPLAQANSFMWQVRLGQLCSSSAASVQSFSPSHT